MSAGALARTPARLLLLAVLVLVAGCTTPTDSDVVHRQGDPGGYLAGTSIPDPYAMPDQTLTDAAGRPYNLIRSPSKPVVLLFFGYTHCPDVCVAVLSEVATALQRSDPSVRNQIQVVFVTTDPARDKPAVVGAYLDRFDPSFVGLTGNLSTIKSLAGRVGVDIQGLQRLPSGGYEVGHSAQVIGFNAAHRGVVLWTPDNSIADLKHDYGLLVERAR